MSKTATNDILAAYNAIIAANPVMTNGEIIAALATKNPAKREKVILANVRLVIKNALRYKGMHELEDNIGNGMLGLVNAADHYDPKQNVDFAAFATIAICNAIKQGIDRARLVNHKPYAEMTEEEKATASHSSLNDKNEEGKEYGDTIAAETQTPYEECAEEERYADLINAINKALDAKEQYIVKAHNGIGMAKMRLEDIAQKLNLTHQRVSQIEQNAMGKIKAFMEA